MEVTGLPTVLNYTDKDFERILLQQNILKPTLESILNSSVEYTKCMILMQNYSGDNFMDDRLDELAQKIAKLKVAAQNKYMKLMQEYEKKKEEVRNSLSESKTTYATFHLLSRIAEYCISNPDKGCILFIDELNRGSNEVMQELMNLILNREINGFKLPKNCKVVAAANPSSSFYDFRDSNYQVSELDDAQLARLSVICMEASERQWLSWGTEEGEDNEPNIQDEVTEFIASQPELLITKKSPTDDVNANPRSWYRVSETIKTIKNNSKYTQKDLYNKIVGDVGATVATTFITFLRERKNPLITPEEIFTGKFTQDKKDRIVNESYPRKLTILNNSMRYLSGLVRSAKDGKKEKQKVDIFLELIGDDIMPKELMVTAMSTLINNDRYKKLNDVLMDEERYLDLYQDAHNATRDI